MTQHVCPYLQYLTSEISDTATFYINWDLFFFEDALYNLHYENKMVFHYATFHEFSLDSMQ